MKDRLLTLALALGALVAFYVLMFPKPQPPQEQVTRPLTTEAGTNGYLALQRWLQAEQVPTLSLRERYGQLQQLTADVPSDNLLISTTPHAYPLRPSEAEPLRDWIAAGNTLLVLAGLSDTPEWSTGQGIDPQFMDHMEAMTGLTFHRIVPPAPDGDQQSTTQNALTALRKLAEPQRSESAPRAPHPLLEGVQAVVAVSEYPSDKWTASTDDAVLFELMADRAGDAPALWLLPYGEGQIIVSAYGSLFTNKLLGERDNARLLSNIVLWSLGPQGKVLIDDAHQGLVSFYDPEKFFGDARLHRSLWWLLALWLVFVVGPRRLRATTSSWNPLDVTSFVRATGGFMARVVKPAAAGQRLFENFFNEIRQRLGLVTDGTPVWDWLDAHATIPSVDLRRLRELHERVARRGRVALPELHNLLMRVRALLN